MRLPPAGLAALLALVALAKERRAIFLSLAAGALVLVAGLMSGLTLGLMSLDSMDLELLRRSGSRAERAQAAAIAPVLARPHWLLVTLVLANAACTEALPIVLDRLADPVTAVMLSIVVVLVFGEIIPQALCSRFGLVIGAHAATAVRALMLATAPISWPISKLLDVALGPERTALFKRGQLKALVDLHSAAEGGHLSADECAVIRGALDLSSKTAADCLTPLARVFMVPGDAVLDEATLGSILASGHSRIPVHKPGYRGEVVGMLLAKELIMVDPARRLPVASLQLRSLPHLRADTRLYDILRLFETGRCHMAVLTRPPPVAYRARRRRRAAATAGAAARVGRRPGGGGGGSWETASLLGGEEGDDTECDDDDLTGDEEEAGVRAGLVAGLQAAEAFQARADWESARARERAVVTANLPGWAATAATGARQGIVTPFAAAATAVEVATENGGAASPPAAKGADLTAPAAAAAAPSPAASSSSSSFEDLGGETIGVVTIEDVLEELLQAEIIDETDAWLPCASGGRGGGPPGAGARLAAPLLSGPTRIGPLAAAFAPSAGALPPAARQLFWGARGGGVSASGSPLAAAAAAGVARPHPRPTSAAAALATAPAAAGRPGGRGSLDTPPANRGAALDDRQRRERLERWSVDARLPR